MEYKYQDSLNILFVAPLKNNAAGIKNSLLQHQLKIVFFIEKLQVTTKQFLASFFLLKTFFKKFRLSVGVIPHGSSHLGCRNFKLI